jgi:hypothetical protein
MFITPIDISACVFFSPGANPLENAFGGLFVNYWLGNGFINILV